MESYIEQDRNAMEGSMDVGFIGVGRMGKAMTRNLLKAGHRVRAWDTSRAALDEIAKDGAEIAASATPSAATR
jgi:3-hydroxyisobutyrate dehydrogenase-like beta-hydroxyacid dehydrogenase